LAPHDACCQDADAAAGPKLAKHQHWCIFTGCKDVMGMKTSFHLTSAFDALAQHKIIVAPSHSFVVVM
jgi:hypothetical protein